MTATAACAEGVLSARYDAPTDRYRHGILGDAIEWGALVVETERGERRFVLPIDRVFEDLAPRLADLDGDGDAEVIVIETQAQTGAQLAVYDGGGKIAATPHIGRSNRWLAPVGAADLDGDGSVEIAYIDRPHLAKTLRVWRFANDRLTHVADLGGLTNHRIGEDFISGGLRDCGAGPEMVTASADWQHIMVTRLMHGVLTASEVADFDGPDSIAAVLNCAG